MGFTFVLFSLSKVCGSHLVWFIGQRQQEMFVFRSFPLELSETHKQFAAQKPLSTK